MFLSIKILPFFMFIRVLSGFIGLAAAMPVAVYVLLTSITPAQAAEVAPPRYTDPIWSPVRADAYLGEWHHYDHIDYDVPEGTPVYASGNGELHYFRPDDSSSTNTGQHLWIDHSGGTTSTYMHLDVNPSIKTRLDSGSVFVNAGDLLGTVYSWPVDGGTRNVDYLHFDTRGIKPYSSKDPYLDYKNGFSEGPDEKNSPLHGLALYPKKLLGCDTAGNMVPFPIPLNTDAMKAAGGGGPGGERGAFLPGSQKTPCKAPSKIKSGSFTATAKPEGATLSWSSTAKYAMLSMEKYAQSTSSWRNPAYRKVPASGTLQLSGLFNAHLYRFKVAFHYPSGFSLWISRKLSPGGVPDAPAVGKVILSSKTMGYSLVKPAYHGYPVLHFRVKRSCIQKGAYSLWEYQKSSTVYTRWSKPPKTTCKITAQAINARGASPWSKVLYFKTN
jgi:hypothetical protein